MGSLRLGLTVLLVSFYSFINAQDFVYDWVRKAGGERWDLASDVAIDKHKNVYLTGGFESVAFFGTDSLVSKGERDIFIAKYDSLGTPVWLRTIGGVKYDNAADLQIKDNGNILIAGNFQDTCHFGEQTLICNGYMHNFIAEYSPLGNLINLKSIQADSKAENLFITLTDTEDFYLSGTWYGKLSFEGDTLESQGSSDMFMIRFGKNLSYEGTLRIGGTESEFMKDMEFLNNTFYIYSEFNDSIDINQNKFYSYGSSDILILTADTIGNILNSKHFAGFGADCASALSFDSDTNIYVCGDFESHLYFGSDSLISSGGKDIFLIKTDKNLNTLWSEQIGGISNEYAKSLSVNTNDAIYLSGSFNNALTIGSKTIVSADSSIDMFISKYSAQGTRLGVRQAGGSGNDYSNLLINDKQNYLYIIGNFDYDFAFETDSVSSDSLFAGNNEDVFLARFYDCDNARYPEIGNDTTFCGNGVLKVLNPEGSGITGSFRKYLWNTGQKTKNITVYDSGYYYVSTIDNHKCPVRSDSIFVAVYPLPEPDLGQDVSLFPGQTVNLTGGEFETYLWNNGTTNISLTVAYDSLVTFSNTYSLTVTDEFGCTATDLVQVFAGGAYYAPGSGSQNQTMPYLMTDGGEGIGNKATGGLNFEPNPQNKELLSINTEIYPNPSNGVFYVNTSKIKEQILEIRIYTADGKQVYSNRNISGSPFEISIDSTGSHYLVLETENSLYFEKIMIN